MTAQSRKASESGSGHQGRASHLCSGGGLRFKGVSCPVCVGDQPLQDLRSDQSWEWRWTALLPEVVWRGATQGSSGDAGRSGRHPSSHPVVVPSICTRLRKFWFQCPAVLQSKPCQILKTASAAFEKGWSLVHLLVSHCQDSCIVQRKGLRQNFGEVT